MKIRVRIGSTRKAFTAPESAETPACEGYRAAERFGELREGTYKSRQAGSSVAALLNGNGNDKETRLVYGRVIMVKNENNGARVHIITREGQIWSVMMANVVGI